MAAEQPNNIKKPLCAGLLAHVDAGKTTLSEAMLYEEKYGFLSAFLHFGGILTSIYTLRNNRHCLIFGRRWGRNNRRTHDVSLFHRDYPQICVNLQCGV